jgi:putative ABC transport system permease protein
MTIFTIVRKNLTKRSLSTSLTILSVAVGVGLVLAVTTIQQQTEDAYRQTSAGFDLILAAKGSAMQTTLNTMYHLETSTGVIPYALYEAALRDPRVEYAYPLYVGDSYRGIRVVGTSESFLRFGEPIKAQSFRLEEGRAFSGLFEVVLGSNAAQRTSLSIGDTLTISHGLVEVAEGAEAMDHDHLPVTVVGILQPTGTAHDNVIFTDYKTTTALHSVKFQNHLHADDHDHVHSADEIEVKQLDAVMLRMKNPQAALQLAGLINYPTPDNPFMRMQMARDPFFPFKTVIMAVIPAQQISALLSIVGNAERVLKWVSSFVIVVALLSVLIALYNTMEGRRRDLAIFRTLGARRTTLLWIMMFESSAIVLIGSALGWLGGQLLVSSLAPFLLDSAGIVVRAFQHDSGALLVILGMIGIGILIGMVPGIKAYRNDPVQNLSPI